MSVEDAEFPLLLLKPDSEAAFEFAFAVVGCEISGLSVEFDNSIPQGVRRFLGP